MKKVLIITGTLNSGGAERNASILANGLSEKGYDVSVAHVLPSGIFYFFNSAIRIFDLSDSKQPKNFFKIGKKIRKLQVKEKYDVIISFFFVIGAITQLFCPNKKDVCLICRETGDPKSTSRDTLIYKTCDIILRKSNKIVFQNTYQKSCYSKKLQKKSVIIHNPISTVDENIECNFNSKRIISVGRLEKVKDFETMIRGFALFASDHKEYVLDIFGDGTQKDFLEKLIGELDMRQNIFLRGKSTNVVSELSKSRIYLHTSMNEGMPNALLEAFLLGIPVISTDWDGYSDFLTDKTNCLIIQKKNPVSLCKAIEKEINDKELCHSFIEESQKVKNLYGKDYIIEQWEAIFDVQK